MRPDEQPRTKVSEAPSMGHVIEPLCLFTCTEGVQTIWFLAVLYVSNLSQSIQSCDTRTTIGEAGQDSTSRVKSARMCMCVCQITQVTVSSRVNKSYSTSPFLSKPWLLHVKIFYIGSVEKSSSIKASFSNVFILKSQGDSIPQSHSFPVNHSDKP